MRTEQARLRLRRGVDGNQSETTRKTLRGCALSTSRKDEDDGEEVGKGAGLIEAAIKNRLLNGDTTCLNIDFDDLMQMQRYDTDPPSGEEITKKYEQSKLEQATRAEIAA